MGTITVYEYDYVGGDGETEANIPMLSGITRTQDATTSSSVESITLQANTSAVRIVCDADHRVGQDDTALTSNYEIVGTTEKDFGVKPGKPLYYRTDA